MVKITSSESFIATLTFGSILASFFKEVFPALPVMAIIFALDFSLFRAARVALETVERLYDSPLAPLKKVRTRC